MTGKRSPKGLRRDIAVPCAGQRRRRRRRKTRVTWVCSVAVILKKKI